MRMLTVAEADRLAAPHPFAALVTKDAGGKTNIMGVSWFTMVSIKDAKLLLCLSQKGHTGSVVRRTKQATLCLLTQDAAQKIMACCRMSGADHNKIEENQIVMHPCEGMPTEVPDGAGLCFALELDELVETCDHGIYICSIKSAAELQDGPYLYAFEGYREIKLL